MFLEILLPPSPPTHSNIRIESRKSHPFFFLKSSKLIKHDRKKQKLTIYILIF